MKYLLGIDFGGGSSKGTLLSERGEVVATHSVEYPTFYPKNGYVEQNPLDWYSSIKQTIPTLLKKGGVDKKDLVAICFDAATHTAVLTDDDGNILRPAIYWSDSRSKAECEYIRNNYGELVLSQALHSVDTIWTLPQLLWVKNNEPEIWTRIRKIFFPKDYIRYLLTKQYVTDYIEAEGSMLFDYNKLCWSKELCDIIGLDIDILPKVISPTDFAGKLTEEAAHELGLCTDTKIICGTTDTALEIFASGAVNQNQATIKLATAGRICLVTSTSLPHKHLINYSHVVKGLWYPGTATKACASSYRWFRDTFGGDYKELDEAAKDIPVGCDGLIYHPYLNGELTPYADPNLCGSFTGIRAMHTKAHFARAVMEGVALSLMDCKRVFEELNVDFPEKASILGGGAGSKIWRQIIADALDIELVQNETSDSSFGGAMLAGIAVGIFSSPNEAIEKCTKTISITKPNHENTQKYKKLFEKYRKLHDALAPIYSEL